jgi:tetratricopeptide (TPR) repeat protein
MVVGDFRKPLSTGWEQGVEDELLRQDIADATQGNPERRLSSAQELTDRIRQREARHAALAAQRRAAAAQAAAAEAAEAARRENDTLRARRAAFWSVLAAIFLGLVVSLNFAWEARRAEREATEAATSAKAVTAFLSEDLLGAIDPSTRKGREVDLISVLDAGAAKIEGRFGKDLGGKAQAYVALMKAYENFPARPLQELLPLWKKHYEALSDWMTADPASAFPVAYKVIQNQPDIAYLRDHERLVKQLKAYAATAPEVSVPVCLNVALLEATLLTQDGRWRSAVNAYQQVEEEVFQHFDAMLQGNSWSLSTFVRDNGSLQRLATAQRGCRKLLDYQSRHPELSLEDTLDYAFACTAEATYSGDFARLLSLATEGAARAKPVYAEEDGYMQTFYGWQGMALIGLGRFDEAAPLINRTIALREKTRSGIYLAGTYTQRGWLNERRGDWAAAAADYQKASAALTDFRNNPRIVTAQAGLARALAHLGRAAEAEAALAVIPQSVLDEMPPHYRSIAGKRRAEALILRLKGDEAGAQAAFKEAESWLAADFGPDHVWTREARDERLAVRQDAP